MAVAVKEGPDCIGTARRREQPVQPNQSCTGQKKVLLSASNDPLDNHTGTKRLYLTLIANPGPPISELHDSPALPRHLPAQSREPSLNGIYNHPSSVSTLIVILRPELCIKHLARLNRRPWLQCLLWALLTFPSQPRRPDAARVAAGLPAADTWWLTPEHVRPRWLMQHSDNQWLFFWWDGLQKQAFFNIHSCRRSRRLMLLC